MSDIITRGYRVVAMVNKTCVTVDVDSRGRFTVPDPARRALDVSEETTLELRLRVLKPSAAENNKASVELDVDRRGRITLKPSSLRKELGIHGQEATLEVTLSKKNHRIDGY